MYDYDALGREIDLKLPNGAGTTQFFYDGSRVIEQRDKNGNVTTQYVWAPDNSLVLRDRDADNTPATADARIPNPTGVGLDERLYVLTDAATSVTAIADIAGNVLERFTYNQDGLSTNRGPNWTDAAVGSSDGNPDPYDWQYQWHGMRWQPMNFTDSEGDISLAGMYTAGGAGQTWFDPVAGRTVQPNPVAYQNGLGPYQDPGLTMSRVIGWGQAVDRWTPNGLLGRGLNWVGSQLDSLGSALADNGYGVLGGLAMYGGGVWHAAGGIVDAPGSIAALAQNAITVGNRDGAWAGVGYFAGSFVGATQLYEAYEGEDLVTGKPLNGSEQAARVFGAISTVALLGAGAAGWVGFNPALGGSAAAADAAASSAGVAAADSSAVAADSAAGQVAGAEQGAQACSNPLETCFTAGTLVAKAAGLVAIDTLRPGQRVMTGWTVEGGVEASATAVDPATWKRVRLQMTNRDGWDVIDIDLLRPPSWLFHTGAEVGSTIRIGLSELVMEGAARVVAIEPCPELEKGPGRVVTATITHLNGQLLEVKLEGLDRPVEPTAPHRFYSESRADWVTAESLEPGERLRTKSSAPATVEWLKPKPGVHRVYNIEVEHEHEYYVWVHARSCKAQAAFFRGKAPWPAARRYGRGRAQYRSARPSSLK